MPLLTSGVARVVRLARLLGVTAGKNALRSSFTLYLTIGIGAFVLFAGNGLDARTVTALATTQPSFGFALTMVWVLAALPVVRALVASPDTYFLRALPIARSAMLALLGVGLVIAHLPWAALWARGAGPASALAATLIALALEGLILASVRRAADLVAPALAAAAVVFSPSHPVPATLLAGPAFLLGIRQAYIRAPEPRSVGRDAICMRSRALALASALGVSVYRGHAPVLARALLLAFAACTIVVLGLRNNEISDAATIRRAALMVWAPACVFGAVGMAGPVLRAEGQARWLLDVCGASLWLRSASAAGLLAAWAAAVGSLHGIILGEALDLAWELRLVLALENATAGAAWAGLALSIVRITRSTPPYAKQHAMQPASDARAATRLLLAIAGLGVASAVLLTLVPQIAALLLLVSAAGTAALAARVRNPW